MLNKLHKNRGGFTLVEIMIVVAIIALLAAVAVPNFLRARKRSQATSTLETLRMIDGAMDQYAIETSKSAGASVDWADLAKYIKEGNALQKAMTGGLVNDAFGHEITVTTIDTAPKVPTETVEDTSDVIPDAAAFWGPYYSAP